MSTPARPPNIAPVAYASRAAVVPTATRRTLTVHRYDIPNPAAAMPGQYRFEIKYVLALTKKTVTNAVIKSLVIIFQLTAVASGLLAMVVL